MSKLSDNDIVEQSTFVRLKELEVDKAKIEAGKTTDAQQSTRQLFIWLTAILIFLMGSVYSIQDFNTLEEIEITARALAKDQASVERAKQHTEQAKLLALQLQALIEIVRHSKTDELALEVMRQLPQK